MSGCVRRSATTAAAAIKSFSDIPGPATFPILGSPSTLKFRTSTIERYHEDLLAMYGKYGPIFKETYALGFGNVVHVFSPEDAMATFQSDGKNPFIVPLQSTTQKYRQMKGMNPGLGNLNGEEWYRLRAAVQQAMMRPEAVLEYLPFVNQVADKLVDHIAENIDDNGEAPLKIIAGRLGALAENVAWADRLIDINHQVFQLSARMRFSPPFYKYFQTPNWRKMVKLEDEFYWEVDKLSTEAIAKLTSSEASEDNHIKFASKLINKPTLSHNDIKTILLSLFTDGLNTTTPTLIYNMYLLATNPACQDILREQLKQINPNNAAWTKDMVDRSPYLRACIKESFRLLTISTEISRIPQKDIVLGGYAVPAGTNVEIHTFSVQDTEEYFKNAKEFKPTRWLREGEEYEKTNRFIVTPFGHGPRMCAGRRFADQDLLVVIAKLVTTYKIEYLHGPLKRVYETMILPVGDCKFKFTPVESQSQESMLQA